MELNAPTALLIDALALPRGDIVADNLQVLHLLLAEQMAQQRPNDGLHTAAEDHNGDIVCAGPRVEGLEAGIEDNVLEEQADALVVRGLDALHHLEERVAEVAPSEQHVGVALLAQLDSEAQVIRHEVVAVLDCDRPVEIGEEDELGVRGQRRQRGGGRRGYGPHDGGLQSAR